MGVFVFSTAINFLDRATLAALGPVIRDEFHLSHAQYGWIVNAFMFTYTLSAPFAGMLVDRIGLNRAISLAIGLWSCAGIATGFTRGLGGLAGCRAVLGVAEAGGVPAAGKAIHQYLRPAERALGNGLNQCGVSLGLMLAPPLATWIASRAGWRQAFVITGMLGLAWIPVWNWTSRRVSPLETLNRDASAGKELLRDRRLWAFVAANALSMVPYTLWANWTQFYLVDVHHLSNVQAAWYAWIPPVFAAAGGIAGGWLSLRWTGLGKSAIASRYRVCLAASLLSLATVAIPSAPSAAWGCVGVSASFFLVAAFSVNMYSMPLDAFGGSRAAFAVSMLTASSGAAGLISPVFGKLIDLDGYSPVIRIAAMMPLAACALLWGSKAVR